MPDRLRTSGTFANAAGTRKIVDAFIFFNELQTLDMRLHELDDTVDYFVIVESQRTHSGKPKPLHFLDNQSMFRRFIPKIIHHVVDGRSRGANLWQRLFPHRNSVEFQQRAAIKDAIEKVPNIGPDDIVLISDADEVPSPTILRSDVITGDRVVVFYQRYFFYDFSCENAGGWHGTIGTTFRQLSSLDLNRMRKTRNRAKDERVIIIPDTVARETHAGWHCSNFGGVERIITKLEFYTHQRYNRRKYKDPDNIARLIKEKKDLIFRSDTQHQLCANEEETDDYLPRFRHLIYRETATDQSTN